MIGLGGAGLPLHSTPRGENLKYRNHTYSTAAGDPLIPAGIAAGDLLIALGHKSPAFQSTPSGWTSIAPLAFTSFHAVAKISDGTETGGVAILDDTSNGGIVLALKGGASSLGSIVDSDIEYTNSNPVPQVKNASTLGVLPFVVVAVYSAPAGTIDPRGWTGDDFDAEKGGSRYYIKWKYYSEESSPLDITVDMDDEGSSNGLASAIIEVNF